LPEGNIRYRLLDPSHEKRIIKKFTFFKWFVKILADFDIAEILNYVKEPADERNRNNLVKTFYIHISIYIILYICMYKCINVYKKWKRDIHIKL